MVVTRKFCQVILKYRDTFNDQCKAVLSGNSKVQGHI